MTNDPSCLDPDICDNYLASGQEVFRGDQFDVRTDYNASSRLRLFGRYSFGDFYDNGTPAFGTDAGGTGTNPAGFAGVARTRNQGISSGFTYSLNPKILTDFRFGYFRYRLNLECPGLRANSRDRNTQHFCRRHRRSLSPRACRISKSLPRQTFPSVTGDYFRLGYSNVANSCSCPLREREQQFQFVNNWTRNTGRHMIKWGADLRYLQNYRFDSGRPPTGFFSFAPSLTGQLAGEKGATGLGLATFLIGDVTSFERVVSSPAQLTPVNTRRGSAFTDRTPGGSTRASP